ncbi:MAG: transcription antitermination factor NusB [bacterium]|nr:transcription antitermination factor NusB [bacterium]
MGKRSKARELALQSLYELEEPGKDPGEVLQATADRRNSSKESIEYAGRLISWTLDEQVSLDKAIAGQLRNWKLDRVSLVLRIILRQCLAEGRHAPEVPISVIINEAVELSRKYDSDEATGFINGVLEKLLVSERES